MKFIKKIKYQKTAIHRRTDGKVLHDSSKNLDGILLKNMYIGLAEYYSSV